MGFGSSKIVTSPQFGIHPHLQTVVKKHLSTEFLRPIAEHNQQAFETAFRRWSVLGQPLLLLDSACGTAESTRFFSRQHDNHLVIGLDQSSKRLANSQNRELPENCLLLRCDCTDFWRLAHRVNWCVDKHYLLYPNPWPKPQHLQRRWHGHPAFPDLLAISKSLELRTNWKTYAGEFCNSLEFAGLQPNLTRGIVGEPISAFERKYQRSGHSLWQVAFHRLVT